MNRHPQPLTANGPATSLELPQAEKTRPVRRGHFWPGESFTAWTSKWDLTGRFVNHAYVLPAVGSTGRRPH
jgi:hypothetical protein